MAFSIPNLFQCFDLVRRSNSSSSDPVQREIRGFFSRLSIVKKISYGYGLAIGVAVCGTTVGLLVGDYYYRQAQQQLAIANQQQQLLSDIDNAVMAVQAHPQRLLITLETSIWFDYEVGKFSADVNRVDMLLAEFEKFTQAYPEDLATDASIFATILARYHTTTNDYAAFIQSLWQQLNPEQISPNEVGSAQQLLITQLRDHEAAVLSVEFDRLAEELKQLKNLARQQQQLAQNGLNQAGNLRLVIVGVGIGLSVAIAAGLARMTSRAIAQPIKTVTAVAQAVTHESNFELRSPVTTADEVGSLAMSLNQLIQRIGDYTKQLEHARDTLEQRVAERTQTLTQTLKELQQTQTHLIHSEKMSSLGQLVAGVAHEINNPVNFISGNLVHAEEYIQDLTRLIQLYRHYTPIPAPEIADEVEAMELDFLLEDLPKLLKSMQVGANRIREIVLSLRNFSRLDEAELKVVDIHEGLDSTLMILQNRLKAKADQEGISVVKSFGNLPLVQCYAGQLNQVFMNLLANAIDALEEKSNRTSSASPKPEALSFIPQASNPTIWIHTETIDSEWVQIRILDNGPGIPEPVQRRLFEPFFTTKPVGKGTGLGLSISYQIISERHGGVLQCFSQLHQGTEFVIQLPVAPRSVQTTATAPVGVAVHS